MPVLISLCSRVSGAAQGCAENSAVQYCTCALLGHWMPEPGSSESVLLGMPDCVAAVNTCRADCLYC